MSSIRKLSKLLDSDIRRKNLRALRYRLRGVWWQTLQPAMPDPVFLIGCSRSGTTVTYQTFAESRELRALGYELPEFWDQVWGPHDNGWASEAAGAGDARPEHRDAALRYFFERLGAGQVIDKTCINVMRVPYLLQLFPQARFVFIHRDGRDNISSLMDGWRFDRHFGLNRFLGAPAETVAIDGGAFDEWSFFLPPGWRDYNQAPLEEVCAFQWLSANRMALDARAGVPDGQWVQMRYEDIFEQPVEMFEQAFARLGLEFDTPLRKYCETLNKRPTSIVNGAPRKAKWKQRNPEAIERILDRIEPMQKILGYSSSK